MYLDNEYLAGTDKFRKDLTTAYNFLENGKKTSSFVDTSANDGICFSQTNAGETSRALKDLSRVRCYEYGVFGHKRNDGKCKSEDVEK